MHNNVIALRKNQFLILMFMSALLLGGCKSSTHKTIIMDIDTVQVKEIRFYGKHLDHVYVQAQNKRGRDYEAWGMVYNGVVGGGIERGDWLVIDGNPENHPWGEPDIKFRAYENLTTGNVDSWYAQHLRQGIKDGKDSITLTNKIGRTSRTFVIHRQK